MYLESSLPWVCGQDRGNIQKKLEFSFLDVCVGGHDGLWHGDAHGSMWAMGIEMVKLLIG